MNAVAVVVPVYRNASTLDELRRRLEKALVEPWTLRLVVDACPDGSAVVANDLARLDPRVHVTELTANVGQHAALAIGLAAETDARAWICMDGDLQDPPEAVPALVRRLDEETAGVFAGRRGTYEGVGRRLTGNLLRRLLSRLTPLPPDAGAFFALDARLRAAVLEQCAAGAPSVVAAAGTSGLPLRSVPVTRAPRPDGRSAWTSRARLRQGVRTLRWTLAARRRSTACSAAPPGRRRSHGRPLPVAASSVRSAGSTRR